MAKQCPICLKKMPKTIVPTHIRKSHPEVFGSSSEDPGKEQKQGEAITGADVQTDDGSVKLESAQNTDEHKKWYDAWDAGDIEMCKQCRKEYPREMMQWHVHLSHGL